jgi:hypothetical protein
MFLFLKLRLPSQGSCNRPARVVFPYCLKIKGNFKGTKK